MSPQPKQENTRLHFLDNMRTLCLLIVFIFHCSLVFDTSTWHIKNYELLNFSSVEIMKAVNWVMPILFFISGASIWFSVQKRSLGTFIKNTFKRFVFPIVLGCTVLAIPQIYLERVSTRQFNGSIVQFIPHYFEGWYGFGGNFAWSGLHIWFLQMLFIFTLLSIPFFFVGKRLLGNVFFQKLLGSPFIFLFFAFLTVLPTVKLHYNSWLGKNVWWLEPV